MKTTNIQILETLNFLQQFEEKCYPQRISYGILKNLQILSKEQEVYTKTLRKIIDAYEDKIAKDEMGNPQYNENGLPKIMEDSQGEFYKEVNDLLLTEIEITPYFISENVFDYENVGDRYDTMSPRDMHMLMSILCKAPENNTEEV